MQLLRVLPGAVMYCVECVGGSSSAASSSPAWGSDVLC